jgi:hypothetical protein
MLINDSVLTSAEREHKPPPDRLQASRRGAMAGAGEGNSGAHSGASLRADVLEYIIHIWVPGGTGPGIGSVGRVHVKKR